MNPWAGHPSKVNGEGRQTEGGARVVDNSSIHSTPAIKRRLKRDPRFHLHFTPTYSSWLNLVERWFANLTDQALRRSSHKSTSELEDAIHEYVEASNDAPKPFV